VQSGDSAAQSNARQRAKPAAGAEGERGEQGCCSQQELSATL